MTPAPTVCQSGIEPRRILICQKKSPRKLDVWDASKPYSTIVYSPLEITLSPRGRAVS